MKVLIASASAGLGHVKAAEALLAAFHKEHPGVRAEHLDILSLARAPFRELYAGGYGFAAGQAPALWAALYGFWDCRAPDGAWVSLLNRLQRTFAAPFLRHVADCRPDLILGTHFLVPQLFSAAAASVPRIELAITDYEAHQFWLSPAVSRYYLAHDGMVEDLLQRGIPAARAAVTGIPVHPAFSEPVDREAVLKRLRLDPRQPIVLILGGGIGLSTLEDAVRRLARLTLDIQILTVAGRNSALRRRLDGLALSCANRLVNLGFVDNMHELLAISAVVVTKPGGLTVTECLARRSFIILTSPIPGQEENNARFLIRSGAALRAESVSDIPFMVERLLTTSPLRQRLQAGVRSCSRPEAAFAIARSAVSGLALPA